MTVTISRLYNNYSDARVAVHDLEAAGVKHGDISVIASNADNRFEPIRRTRRRTLYSTAILTVATTERKRRAPVQASALR